MKYHDAWERLKIRIANQKDLATQFKMEEYDMDVTKATYSGMENAYENVLSLIETMEWEFE